MDDKMKWNRRYLDRLRKQILPEPNQRLQNLSDHLRGGNALDIACGLGGNSLFLARKNYHVDALDISEVAIGYISEQAKRYKLSIQSQIVDLVVPEKFNWPRKNYDLIVICHYLDRSLFPLVRNLITENGYFFMETYYQSPLTVNQGVSDKFKLQSKELLMEFNDWKVLFFEENEHEGRQTIFCQKLV